MTTAASGIGDTVTQLSGKRVAFLATNGFEDRELTHPWEGLTAHGATATMVAPTGASIVGKRGHIHAVDWHAEELHAAGFDALVLPGGIVNADHLRLDGASVRFVSEFFAQHKPVSVICHGAWILIEADVVNGRRLTSTPSLRTDLLNAGAIWLDEEVVVDQGLVSSRTPEDLPAFTARTIEKLLEGPPAGQTGQK